MAEVKTTFEPSTADDAIRRTLARAENGLTITAIGNDLFPLYSPQWTRERIRRMALAGLLEIDTTTRPAIVRLPGRQN